MNKKTFNGILASGLGSLLWGVIGVLYFKSVAFVSPLTNVVKVVVSRFDATINAGNGGIVNVFDIPLTTYLLDRKVITVQDLAKAYSIDLGITYVDHINETMIDTALLSKIQFGFFTHYQMV